MSNLDKHTNALLQQGLVKTPSGFRDDVMQDIAKYERERQSLPANEKSLDLPSVPWWQWAAVTIGSVIGGGQVLRFIFSVWFATSAAY